MVITIDDNGAWELAGGAISGGTVAATNNAVLKIAPGARTSALDAVNLASDLMLSPGATLYLSNGLTLQKSTVAVDGDLICQGTQTIGGAGTFIFNGSAGPDGSPSGSATPLWYLNTGRIYPTSGVMTIGIGISIKTGQGDGIIGQSGTTINQGTISSITSGRSINLLGNFINQGTISVANGGVRAAANHLLGPGGFTNDGGTVNVEQGSVFNCGGKLVLTNGVIGGDGDVVASVGATVNGAVTKPGAGVIDVHSPGLTLAQDAQLNLTVGKLIARAPAAQLGTWNGSTYTDLTGLIQSGRNGGTWDGPGIMTSDSNGGDHNEIGIATASQALGISSTQTGTWMGRSVSGGDVLVMYTYGGDANLDGKINIDDYGRIDASVGQSGSLFGWYNGDFNYDGKINIDDYGIIDSNIGSQGPPLGLAPASLAGLTPADGITAVPEPSSLLLLVLPLLAMPTRRRRSEI